MALSFNIVADDRQFLASMQRSGNGLRQLSNQAISEGNKIEDVFRKIAAAAGITFSAMQVKSFVDSIIEVRGQTQQLEIAFTTMLKSREKAAKLMSDLTTFAAQTPFGLMDSAKGAKQLLAYGSQAENVVKELRMLGDVAAGTGQQIGDLVYLYGTLRTQGRAYLMDIRQFAGRGIPIYDELAKVLNTTKDKVNDFVSAGKVGFKEIEQAFKNMTSEGSLYGGLMDEQSKSITGRIEQLKDAVDVMFNDMGKNSEGGIYSVIDGATSLVENYEKVGKIILELIATYGAYKAVLISVNAIQSLNSAILQGATVQMKLAAMAGKTLTKAEALQIARTNLLTVAKTRLSAALKSLHTTMLSNPYAIAAMAIVALGYAVYKLATYETALAKAQREAAEFTANLSSEIWKETTSMDYLFKELKKTNEGTEERKKIVKELTAKYPDYLKGYDLEKASLSEITRIQREANDALIENIRIKKLQERFGEINDEYGKDIEKQLSKFTDQVVDMYGVDMGSRISARLQEEIKNGIKNGVAIDEKAFLSMVRAEFDKGELDKGFLTTNYNDLHSNLWLISRSLLDMKTALNETEKAAEATEDELRKISEAGKEVTPDVFDAQEASLSVLAKKANETKSRINELLKNPTSANLSELESLKKLLQEINDEIPKKQAALNTESGIEDEIKRLKELKKDAVINSTTWNTLDGQIKKLENKLPKRITRGGNNSLQKQIDAKQWLANKEKELNNEQINQNLDFERQRIELQKDSFEKRFALAKNDFEKQLQAIGEQGQSLVKAQQEIEKKQWEANGSKGTFKPTTTDIEHLSSDQQERLETSVYLAWEAWNRAKENISKEHTQFMNEERLRFASELDQQLADIDSFYAEKLQKVKQGSEDEAILLANKDKAKKQAKSNNQLREIDFKEQLELERAAGMESIGMTELVEEKKLEITKKYLQLRINALDKLAFSGDEEAFKQMQLLQAELDKLDSQKPAKGLKGIADKSLYDAIVKGFGGSEEAANKFFDSISGGASKVVAIIDDLKGMFGGLSEDLDLALDSIGNIAQGFATGGIVGGAMAVIGEGIKMFAQSAKVNKEHQEALRQLLLARIELQRQYNSLLFEQNMLYKEGTTIFGVDQIGKAIKMIDLYREKTADFKKELQGDWTPDEDLEKNLEKGVSKGGIIGSVYKRQLDEYKQQLKAYNEGVGALANVDIVTGSRKSGWGPWKKRKDVYTPLLEAYDDIIDSEGKLNTARIQAILNTHKMSEENKALLESLLKIEEEAKAAEEELKNYLSETFGSLGDALSDSIVDAFANGEDAALKFQDSVTNVLNNLAKQMVYSLFLSEMFADLQDKIEGVYKKMADGTIDEKQLSKEVTDLLGGFFNGLEGSIGDANKFLESFWQNAEANGFQRPKSEQNSQSSSKGGYETMSQDQAGEMNGRLTGMQMSLVSIDGSVKESLSIQIANNKSIAEQSNYLQQLSSVQLQSMYHLEDIAKCSKVLPEMADNIKGIKKNTDKL